MSRLDWLMLLLCAVGLSSILYRWWRSRYDR